MINSRVTPVILCGGSGSRLWPRSRPSLPKPFLKLVGERSLFEQVLARCSDQELFEPSVIVTGDHLVGHVRHQLLAEHCNASVIVEPEGKNTAAALALAAHRLPPDAIMLGCASDHHITDLLAFNSAVRSAASLASQGWLVCLGVPASRPETGYGYLKLGEPIDQLGHRVDDFIEKPDLDHAVSYTASGNYLWNAGIFAFRVSNFLEELGRHRPALARAVAESVRLGSERDGAFYPDRSTFAEIVGESVDYAVMENTSKAAVVTAEFDWSDIGNWRAVRDARDRDDKGNSIRGPVNLLECEDVLIDSDGPRVHAAGLKGVIVIVDGQDIVVTTADRAHLVAGFQQKS